MGDDLEREGKNRANKEIAQQGRRRVGTSTGPGLLVDYERSFFRPSSIRALRRMGLDMRCELASSPV